MPLDELGNSYAYCRALARKRARNFYYAFAVLPKDKRDAICAVYAFLRYCDDIADDPGIATNRTRLLEAWREALDLAIGGDFSRSRILPAFHDTLVRFDIPSGYFHELIDGAIQDLNNVKYSTFDELYDYCYKVASVVGLVCIHIFGFDAPVAKRYAEYCGIAFQLTNILRDISEDAAMGRVYIPDEDLWAFGYSAEELSQGVQDDRYRRMMSFETNRARDFYNAARPLLGLVHGSGKPCLCAMMGIYSAILDRIERRDYDVFANRVSLSSFHKIAIASKAVVSSRFAGGAAYRPELQS